MFLDYGESLPGGDRYGDAMFGERTLGQPSDQKKQP